VARHTVCCSPCGIVHDPEWHFEWIIFLNFSCYSFHNHLPQAFVFDQRFAVLQAYEKRPVTFFQLLENHEVNNYFNYLKNMKWIWIFTAFVIVMLQPRLAPYDMKFFLCDLYARLAEALLCKIVRTNCQHMAGRCSCELSTICFDLSLSGVVSKDFSWFTWYH